MNNVFGLSTYRTIGTDSVYYFMRFDDFTSGNTFAICNAYFETGMARFIYPNFVYQAVPESEPNDPYFGYQWHLNNTGQSGGTADADIDMPEAWELTQPKYTKRLAIIDFGFEMDHGDFENDLLMWPYDCVGPDYTNPLPDYEPLPECDTIFDHCYHGTMMLGLIAPIINNSQGLAGIIDSIQIVPVKFADRYGETSPEFVIDALEYCMTSPHNANVICCAWSLKGVNEENEIAINQKLEQLYNYGHPVFFAAGNVVGNYVKYPACSPWVMSVSATDHNDNIRYSYKPGTDTVDIRAPGVDLWSFDLSGESGLNPEDDICNWDEDYYCHYTGSSCATAIVSALAVKLLATRDDIIPPFSPPDALYELLEKSANDLGDEGYDISYGWGRVNANRAMVAIGRGDVNHDHALNVSDAVYLINYIFQGGPAPVPYLELGNVNCDGSVNVSDAVYMINFAFTGGPLPQICYRNLPE